MMPRLSSPPKPRRSVKMIGNQALHIPVPRSGGVNTSMSPMNIRKTFPGPNITMPIGFRTRDSPNFTAPVSPLVRSNIRNFSPMQGSTSESLLQTGDVKFSRAGARLIRNLSFGENKENAGDGSGGVGSLEGRLVDHALSSLPDMVGKVADKHKDYSNEYSKQLAVLDHLKGEVDKVNQKHADVFGELASVNRKLYLVAEDCATASKESAAHLGDIEQLQKDNDHIRNDMRQLEEKVAKSVEKYEEVYRKMEDHKALITEMEKDTEAQKKLQKKIEAVEKLKKEKRHLEENRAETECLLNGEVELELQAHIDLIAAELCEVSQQNKTKEQKISQLSARHNQLRQDISVLTKRNAAQLTRLRKQIPEVQMRNQQKNEHAANLERNITQMRKQQEKK